MISLSTFQNIRWPFKKRMRLLPIVIFMCVMMLSFRAYDVVSLFEMGELPFGFSHVGAVASADNSATSLASSPNPDSSAPSVTPEAPFDPLNLTAEDVRVLESLHEKKAILDKKDRSLEERKALLTTIEERVNKKIAELKTLKGEMEQIVKTHDESENAKLDKLVKIYQTMKPKDAGSILSELDFETLLGVMGRMEPGKIAPIFAKMDPDVVRIVTAELARRQDITDAAHQRLAEQVPSTAPSSTPASVPTPAPQLTPASAPVSGTPTPSSP